MITDRANQAERAEAWTRLMKSTQTTTDDALMDAWRWLNEAIELRERGEVTQEQRIANEAALEENPVSDMLDRVTQDISERRERNHPTGPHVFEHKRANPNDVCKHCGYDAQEHDELNRCPNNDDDADYNRKNMVWFED